jgi:hypothetical protein
MKSDGSDGGKADMIRDMVLDYRAHARQRLKEEFPSISAEVQTLRIDAPALQLGLTESLRWWLIQCLILSVM